MKTQLATTGRRCESPSCRKPLNGRSDKRFCGATCNATAKRNEAHVASPETEENRSALLSAACRYPRQAQAEIVRSDQKRRHPYGGQRPQWSGYCVDRSCECACHGGTS